MFDLQQVNRGNKIIKFPKAVKALHQTHHSDFNGTYPMGSDARPIQVQTELLTKGSYNGSVPLRATVE